MKRRGKEPKATDRLKMHEELVRVMESLDDQIDEYSKNIMGYPETIFMDELYKEYVAFLTNLNERVKTIREMLVNESI